MYTRGGAGIQTHQPGTDRQNRLGKTERMEEQEIGKGLGYLGGIKEIVRQSREMIRGFDSNSNVSIHM